MRADVELLDAWIAGERSAGDALLARHYVSVRRFFDSRAALVADDLTQRTFLECARVRERFRGEGSFRAYLFGIARKQLLMFLRGRDRDGALQPFGPQDAITPTGLMAAREEQRLVLRAFHELTEEQQAVIQLFYWEEMSVTEIGIALGLSVTAVTSRLTRARAAMREHLEQLDVRPAARASVLADLELWTRSVVQR